MTKVFRSIAFSLILAATAGASLPPERDHHCPPDPDTGWLHCDAR